nr:MAG TPA: helix-turn-helix domain protein [Caudoviricetes sp.]
MAIGHRIQEIRKKRGITQKELATEIGCAEITIRQYESGKRQPRLDQISNIARILNVSEYFLIYGDDDNKLVKILAELEERKKTLIKKKYDTDSPKEKYYLDCMVSEIQQNIQSLQQEIKDKTISNITINNLQTRDIKEFDLLTNYRHLNNDGQTEAAKRVQELTEIPRYTEPDKD